MTQSTMFLSSAFKRTLWNSTGLFLAAAWFVLLNGWRPLVLILFAAGIHEAGHGIVLKLFHVSVTSFHVSSFGAEMTTWNGRLSYPKELAAVLAGPAANLFCGILLMNLSKSEGVQAAAGAHFALAVFNLLPVRPLDGGHALQLFLSWILGPDAGERIAAGIGAAVGASTAAALLWVMAKSGGNLWIIPAVVGLAIAAVSEGRIICSGLLCNRF